MSLRLANKTGAGVIFGAALTASRVYIPSIIISQMKLQDFHMMAAFLTASASSALIIYTLDALHLATRQPRPNRSNNWFSAYDANIVGGALIGVGMTATGACPGTVLVQVAAGIKSGWYVALGGLLGGIAYARFGGLLLRSSASPVVERQQTIDAKFNLKPQTVLLAYEMLCLAVIVGTVVLGGVDERHAPYIHPVAGGALIGLAQAASLLLTGSPVGVSSAYEEAGAYLWSFVSSERPRPQISAMAFAGGVLMGALGMTRLFQIETVAGSDVSPLKAVFGGFTMIVGSRLAGGCTSGHGISGMAALSVASVVTVASMFAGGMGSALLFP